MKYLFSFILFLNLTMFYFACTCEPDFVVNEENFGTTFFVTDISAECNITCDTPIGSPPIKTIVREIVIKFNKPVDSISVALYSNITFSPSIDLAAPFYYQNGFTELHLPICYTVLTSPDAIHNCFVFLDDDLNVTLTGSILSFSGQKLDGDEDGLDGGEGTYEVAISEFCGPFQIDTVWHDIDVDPPSFCSSTLHVLFNKPVEVDFLLFNENLLLDPLDSLTNYDFFYPNGMIISYCYSCDKIPAILTALGDGTFPIKSTEGQILDGDENGTDGGDFVMDVEVGCF